MNSGFYYLAAFVFYIIPIVVTILNVIRFCFALCKRTVMRRIFGFSEIFSIVGGIVYTVILISCINFVAYTEPLYIGGIDIFDQFHAPISPQYFNLILILLALAIVAYFIIKIYVNILPPLMIVFLFSFLLIGIILSGLIIVQLSAQACKYPICFLILLPLNFILLSILQIKKTIKSYSATESVKQYKSSVLTHFARILSKSRSYTWLAFLFLFPVLLMIMLVLILFGQQPDAIIKAFTDTSEWTLSGKISPPPVKADGHYLCTVSLRGHQRIVKPLRYGIRHGEKIVVNRQLMVANAFEQFIEEIAPKTHHCIRTIYDKYGYPLSRHIKTACSADVVYFLMKPLELFFVTVLYLFDKKPETRIAKQYLPKL